jgi:hypothetical protein
MNLKMAETLSLDSHYHEYPSQQVNVDNVVATSVETL